MRCGVRLWDPESSCEFLGDALFMFGAAGAVFASTLSVAGLRARYETLFAGVLDAVSELDQVAVDNVFANNARVFYRM